MCIHKHNCQFSFFRTSLMIETNRSGSMGLDVTKYNLLFSSLSYRKVSWHYQTLQSTTFFSMVSEARRTLSKHCPQELQYSLQVAGEIFPVMPRVENKFLKLRLHILQFQNSCMLQLCCLDLLIANESDAVLTYHCCYLISDQTFTFQDSCPCFNSNEFRL